MFISTNPLHPFSHSLTYARYIAIKQQYITHFTPTSSVIIPTYDRVLSAIEKALIEEYWGIRKFLQNLVEGQERNMAQLARIGTVVD